jgi:RNA polymerase sigma factor (sigma-70 family)
LQREKSANRDPSAREDQRLVERCRAGDARAWDRLIEKYRVLVFSVPRRMGLNEEDSADVFQQVFVSLYQNIDRIVDGGSVPRWLAVTASRESLRHLRARSRAAVSGDNSLDDLIASETATAEAEALRAVQSETLWQAVERLGGRCAPLLRLLFTNEEVSYEALSKSLGIPVGAIGPTRARCLEKLRKLLEKEGFFD